MALDVAAWREGVSDPGVDLFLPFRIASSCKPTEVLPTPPLLGDVLLFLLGNVLLFLLDGVFLLLTRTLLLLARTLLLHALAFLALALVRHCSHPARR